MTQDTAAKPSLFGRTNAILSIAMIILGSTLIAGGALLVSLGGSFYYLLTGLAIAGAAWMIWQGDRRGMWLYALMLIGTLIWTLADTGLEIWQLQSRLLAPLVLGIWVLWPYVKLHKRISLIASLILVTVFGGWLWNANQVQTIPVVSRDIAEAQTVDGEWRHYGNDAGGTRFSPISQINASNVSKLDTAWTYRTGVTGRFEATPLMTNNSLYFCTSNNLIIALDPETGLRRWVYDPKVKAPQIAACRGVAYHEVPGASGLCAKRIIFATTDARLMAIDADNGKPCRTFGNAGTIDLTRGMGEVGEGYYYVSSAPAIIRGKIVLGGFVLDNQYVGEPSGVIRAFDAATGAFAWAWDMDRPDFQGEPPVGQSYSRATANSWGPISGDEALGLFYLPMGNATPDYWGAKRSKGTEIYSSGVVALDAETGKLRWSFQATHHDLWDYDVGSQPTLINLTIGARPVPAIIVSSKRGQIFMLDRRSGKPVAPVKEVPAPQGAAPGDFLSSTQPRSSLPSFDGPVWSEKTMWGLTPLDQLWCRIKFRQARYDGPMTPLGLKPSIIFPGSFGGMNWGGVSVDPERKLMVLNWSLMANYNRLIPRREADRMGVKAGGRLVIGMPMPQMGTPFAVAVNPFMSPLGVPCTQPPFGEIGIVDLNSGKLIWSRPLGTSADSGPLGMTTGLPLPMGVPNMGGSVITRSGLIFIGATQERAFRALDSRTGKLLWKTRLPAGGNATPMTYIGPKSGRQFVVIAAGGHPPLQSGASDQLIAFALPKAR